MARQFAQKSHTKCLRKYIYFKKLNVNLYTPEGLIIKLKKKKKESCFVLKILGLLKTKFSSLRHSHSGNLCRL